MMRNITLRQLEILTLIVEHGSFAKCAEHLDISPVAVTNHIKKLEASIGYPLFERTPGEAALLSKHGEQAYRRISALLLELDEIFLDARRGKRKTFSRLRLAADPYIYNLMQDGLTAISDKHPALALEPELDAVALVQIKKQLQENQLDIGYFFTLPDEAPSDSEFVCHIPMSIYVGENHPLANRERVELHELKGMPIIGRSKGNDSNILSDKILTSIGLGAHPIALQTDSLGLILSSLNRNQGFTFMFSGMTKDREYTPAIKRLNLNHDIPKLELRVLLRSSIRHEPFVKNLVKMLNTAIREH